VKLRRKQTVVVAGDLHGNVDNLLTLLSWSGLAQSLMNDEAVLVMLGDAVHPDSGPDLGDMEESVLMTDLIFGLKLRFPSNVYYVLGNHDSFSSEVTKLGIPQGLLWSKRLVELRGDAYRERLANIYASLPLIIYSPVFCACHAGPPQGKLDMEMMLNARQIPHLVHELTWTRQRVPGRPEGYSKKHARRFRKALGLSKKTPFIVGHYPRDENGCIWQDAGGIDGHHVVYSSNSAAIGAFVQYGERMLPQVVRGEPLTQWLIQRTKGEVVAGS
ncbi:MAG: metallophosphoesterase, partial [Gammaproteobacteria bacterium]|nr:metallophosphoesterase [Gammaproteobacteria bacterium]